MQAKTFVITGASSGFGKGVALELGRNHANVVLAARRDSLLQIIAKQVIAFGGTALVVKTDVSNYSDMEHLADTAIWRYGKVDVWINDAGTASIGPFWDIPIKEHERVIDVNLKGVFYGSYQAIAIFRRQGYGTLVNLGSVESEVPTAYQSSYSATKAAVRNFGSVLYQELHLGGYDKIKVVTIMPWASNTPFWQHLANHSGGTVSMAAMDNPQKIVTSILHASVNNKRDVPVGWKARLAVVSHRMFPRLTEHYAAKLARKYQYKAGPPKPASSGNLFHPMQEGAGTEKDKE